MRLFLPEPGGGRIGAGVNPYSDCIVQPAACLASLYGILRRAAGVDTAPRPSYTPGVLKLKDLEDFHEFLKSGAWQDAFQYASEELRLEMIGLIETLLETADEADKVVGEVLFNQEGLPAPDATSSRLDADET